MHRLPSTQSVYRFRLAAVLLCVKCLSFPIALGALVLFLINENYAIARFGVSLMALALLVALLQWLLAARTSCPLCKTSVLAKKHCMTHRHARTFLGSYRLRVAIAIILRNSFHCPYCHEPTAMEVRERKRS